MADQNPIDTQELVTQLKSFYRSTSSPYALSRSIGQIGQAAYLQNIYYKNTTMTDEVFIDDEPFKDDTIGTVKVYGKAWLRRDPAAVGLKRSEVDPSQIIQTFEFKDPNGVNGGVDGESIGDVLKNVAINGIRQLVVDKGIPALANTVIKSIKGDGSKTEWDETTNKAKVGTTDPVTGQTLPKNLSEAKKAQNGYKIEDLLNVDASGACCDDILVRQCDGTWKASSLKKILEEMNL